MQMHRSIRAIMLGLAAALIVTACGSNGGGDSTTGQGGGGAAPSQQQPVSIKVAETAGFPAAFLTWGQQQGHFTKHGLNLTIDSSAGGATVIPGVINGTYQVAGSNGASVLIAASNNLPIRVIGPGTFATTEVGKDFAAVVVRPDSDIKEAKDLAGKTVAVNTLKNIAEVTVRASLQNKGIDHSGIKFAEMGFPEMIPALEQGRIDAAFLIEPWVSIGTSGGNKPVLWPYVEAQPGMEIGTFISSQRYIDTNPKVIEAFRAGLKDTVAAINAQPDAFRAALPQLAKMDPEVAKTVVFPAYKPDVDAASLSFVADRLKEYGIVQQAPDTAKLVLTATPG
jgi:NitT/TauT family transport system substrate-binding protein